MTKIVTSPAIPFYIAGGTMPRNALSYVERDADRELLEALRAGQFCYVLTSRQMGKSSLMVRAAARLREEGYAVAVLDLTAVGQNLSAEQWYDGLLNLLARSLDLEDELEEFWLKNRQIGPLQRWIQGLKDVVLAEIPGQVVLFLEEIDAARSLPFSIDELFAAIRECYNRRAEDPKYNRLTFCLLGVATPSDLIRNPRITPFNIGKRITLTDFRPEEAAHFAEGFRAESVLLPPNDTTYIQRLLARVLYWTGGHPYLTQRLCRAIVEYLHRHPAAPQGPNDIVDRLCNDLFLSPSVRDRDDNLIFVRERLLRSDVDTASLLTLYRQIRAGSRVDDDETNPLISVLRLSGLVDTKKGRLYVRNPIYATVFDLAWIAENMPDGEMRRQQAAYRHGVLRTAVLAGGVLLLMTTLVAFATIQTHEAMNARLKALENLKAANREKEKAEELIRSIRRANEKLTASLRGTGTDRLSEKNTDTDASRTSLLREPRTAPPRATVSTLAAAKTNRQLTTTVQRYPSGQHPTPMLPHTAPPQSLRTADQEKANTQVLIRTVRETNSQLEESLKRAAAGRKQGSADLFLRMTANNGWLLEQDSDGAEGSITALAGGVTQIKVASLGIHEWSIRAVAPLAALRPHTHYVLLLSARADQERPATVRVQHDTPNWEEWGLYNRPQLTVQWQQFRWEFTTPAEMEEGHAQLVLGVAQQTGTVQIRNVHVIPLDASVPDGNPDATENGGN